jgi:methyl-accepting chemotaxis protein
MRVSILTKLLVAFGLVVAFMMTIGLFAVGRLGRDHVHLNQLAERVVPMTRVVGEISSLMNQYRQDQFHYIAADPAERRSHADGSISADLVSDLSAMRARLASAQTLSADLFEHHLLDQFLLLRASDRRVSPALGQP